jgi:hypothetical protein
MDIASRSSLPVRSLGVAADPVTIAVKVVDVDAGDAHRLIHICRALTAAPEARLAPCQTAKVVG